MKDFFFCVCNECGSTEWIECVREGAQYQRPRVIERINWLTDEGEPKYPWQIDIHLHQVFSKMDVKQQKFQNKWISFNYEDLICNDCENRLQPIPLKDIDKEQRIAIVKMTPSERISFANSYNIVKKLEK